VAVVVRQEQAWEILVVPAAAVQTLVRPVVQELQTKVATEELAAPGHAAAVAAVR
jgi:hypothetical protein